MGASIAVPNWQQANQARRLHTDLLDQRHCLSRERSLRHPELKVSTPAHTKHLGWYVEFEFRVAHRRVFMVACMMVGAVWSGRCGCGS